MLVVLGNNKKTGKSVNIFPKGLLSFKSSKYIFIAAYLN